MKLSYKLVIAAFFFTVIGSFIWSANHYYSKYQAALGYAEALTRSSDPEDNRRGGELLRQLVSRDHTDIRVLSLYAFSAFEQQRFGEAVAAWEMMLKLLPAGDARRAVIERSIRLAQEK